MSIYCSQYSVQVDKQFIPIGFRNFDLNCLYLEIFSVFIMKLRFSPRLLASASISLVVFFIENFTTMIFLSYVSKVVMMFSYPSFDSLVCWTSLFSFTYSFTYTTFNRVGSLSYPLLYPYLVLPQTSLDNSPFILNFHCALIE